MVGAPGGQGVFGGKEMKKIREGYYCHKGYDITESKPLWKIEQMANCVFNSPSAAKKFIDNRDALASRRLHEAIKEKVYSRFGITETKEDCYRSIFGEER